MGGLRLVVRGTKGARVGTVVVVVVVDVVGLTVGVVVVVVDGRTVVDNFITFLGGGGTVVSF